MLAKTGPTRMAVPARSVVLRLKLAQLWRRRSQLSTFPSGCQEGSELERAREVGTTIRTRREALGLNLRDLALQTRITTPVLEAMERGWRERLPERTYLTAMVVRLEQALDVPSGSLEAVLPPKAANPLHAKNRFGLRRFTPGSIDVLTTWQGSLLYAVVIGFSLIAVNRQQQLLIEQNSLNLEPVRAALSPQAETSQKASEAPELSTLRPLAELSRQPPQRWLTALRQVQANGPGVLELRLTKPSELFMASGGGDQLKLTNAEGTITLRLVKPLTLTIDPPPEEQDRVLWNGAVLLPQADKPGTYSMPKMAEAPDRERPQTAPLSP